MKSLRRLSTQLAGFPIVADEVLEFHAARILLLVCHCGVGVRGTNSPRIDGLTKFAKLDFLVRYPAFFEKVAAAVGAPVRTAGRVVESHMVRHHYGPWDKRYYQILAYLEARELLRIDKIGTKFRLTLTNGGLDVARALSSHQEFATLVDQMAGVKSVLGNRSGSALKTLIYQVLDEEVAKRPLGEVIQP
jgi:hypothetical protein